MSWLRVDDVFDSHPKVLALGDGVKGDARRWTWQRILLYTTRHGSAVVPANISEAIPRANKKFVLDCIAVGLIDVESDGTLLVHDWPIYADVPVREKVAYYLSKYPEASANEVYRAIGGKRELVLAEVNAYRTTGSPPVPDPVPGAVPGNLESGSQSGSRARAPQPLNNNTRAAAAEEKAQDEDLKNPQQPAAADLDPPSATEIRGVIDQLTDSDHDTFRRLEPLAIQLPRLLWADVVERHHDRIATGRVRNSTGLLRHLLTLATEELRIRAQLEIYDPSSQSLDDVVRAQAISYARAGHPWEGVGDWLTERFLDKRSDLTIGEHATLLELARQAFDGESRARAAREEDAA